MGKANNSGSVLLRPRARLINLIGEGLISDEAVAVVELVKNAYDADASQVTISFEGGNSNKPDKIIIQDDGSGMELDTVLHGWFEPGTAFKEKKKRSPSGRVYQGSKGIGRFAAARLGATMLLETKISSGKMGVNAVIDWGAFRNDGYLDDIQLLYEQSSIPDLKHGTRLTLNDVTPDKNEWLPQDYENLYSRLSRLVSNNSEDFKIILEAPPYYSGEVQPPEILSKPKYQLEGKLDRLGKFTGTISIKGEKPFRVEKENLLGKSITPICGPFKVDIKAWDRDLLAEYKEELSQTIPEIRKDLNAYAGVSIYRDGFRVYPYGEPGNDWAKLDNHRINNPTLRLGNDQVVTSPNMWYQRKVEYLDHITACRASLGFVECQRLANSRGVA